MGEGQERVFSDYYKRGEDCVDEYVGHVLRECRMGTEERNEGLIMTGILLLGVSSFLNEFDDGGLFNWIQKQ